MYRQPLPYKPRGTCRPDCLPPARTPRNLALSRAWPNRACRSRPTGELVGSNGSQLLNSDPDNGAGDYFKRTDCETGGTAQIKPYFFRSSLLPGSNRPRSFISDTSFSPTKPSGAAASSTTSAVTFVYSLEDRFGQETQTAASLRSLPEKDFKIASSFRR